MYLATFSHIQLSKAPVTSITGLLYTGLLDLSGCDCSENKEISIVWFLQGVLKQENVLLLVSMASPHSWSIIGWIIVLMNTEEFKRAAEDGLKKFWFTSVNIKFVFIY